jgi:hypothetical protein
LENAGDEEVISVGKYYILTLICSSLYIFPALATHIDHCTKYYPIHFP